MDARPKTFDERQLEHGLNAVREFDGLHAIEQMRRVVDWCDDQNETFVCSLTLPQLLMLKRMSLLSAWDFYADQWTREQVRMALRGVAPQFDQHTEQPVSYDSWPYEC